jgi:hypothetical protein
LIGAREFETVLESGGKLLVTNRASAFRDADATLNTSLSQPTKAPAPMLSAGNSALSSNGHN